MKRIAAAGLHPGATEHYADAESYERRYSARAEDVAYYLRRCRTCTDVLEYGAGAGRLTIPLLGLGCKVLAVDTSAPMLALMKRRLLLEPTSTRKRATIAEADMRTFSTRRRFDAVVAGFHTPCHLYTRADMEAFLARAYAHLRPGGHLEFDLPLPRIDAAGYDPISQVSVTEMDAEAGPQLLTLRWYFPQEMAMYLDYSGFRAVRLRSDFTGRPIEADTSVYTVSARKPG